MLVIQVAFAQNLALSSTPSASASSAGNYGPSNWVDGIKNGATFGWVGTDPSFPLPAFMEFTWTTPQTFDSVVIFNVGQNFAPPAGNAVLFNGTALLQFWNDTIWQNIMGFSGQGNYGDHYSLIFPPVTGSKMRIYNISTGPLGIPNNFHNPGFDEIEVYFTNPQVTDLAVTQVDFVPDLVNMEIAISATVQNVGTVPVSGFNLSYRVVPSGTPLMDSIPISLQPGDSLVHVFSTAIGLTLPSPIAGHQLCATVLHPDDSNTGNDILCVPLTSLHLQHYEPNTTRLYPNPTTGILHLHSKIPVIKIEVAGMDGRILLDTGPTSYLDLSHLPKGMYMLRIQTHRATFVERIAVVHQ
jgi:hypothetical protein